MWSDGAWLNPPSDWQLIRVADFPDAAAQIGPMICTPERAGLTAGFSDLTITEPITKALHG